MKCKLYLLDMGFSDKNYQGETFFCPDCTMLEGILAKNPNLANFIEVSYIPFEKPREELVSLCGEANQSLPALILPEGITSSYQTGCYKNTAYISDLNQIIDFLVDTYHIAKKHP
ncbi:MULTISPECIES: DUF3088 family protein [Providencia]|jgi:hypothetical protein|uniref:DUF3088 family protein n=1 Tax=Providencia TaxID=586 RepID=UPI001C5AA2B3|nr:MULTISPECIES: DUF3088 family protein [Providencia]ELR5150275.1 DUF3088 family protein [Providencia rettgeri]ELR5153134.1 DUF3088 family protein [Providencia rettgeri]MDR2225946.1 DUF3088 domain-containing protein [Providencia sp.]QXX83181.1 DUF3088 family protein [Providencia sp. R33]